MISIIFIILHIVAILSGGFGLIITIPLHIIVGLMSANNARNKKILELTEEERKENEKKKYEFVFIDMFRKKATWANRDNEWLMLVKSSKDKPPKIGEKVLVLKEDKTFSYEKINEVLEYTETKHLGYKWLCRHVDLERID